MELDFKSKSAKELEKILSDVKKALANAQARDRREARKAAEKAAAEFGFSLSELTDDEKPARKAKKAAKPKAASRPKFANPADRSQTWTGKGRQPNWYRAEVEKGTDPAKMKI
ncbi:H-NS histone family protein [Sulfitobacter sp. PR48]|jgi:DNA-binding protein H-NS|uniref:H-NS histone family protein n=1 Tax=Sulfitobacter porphyrae TaxID=1246864 RepID=A0ABW2B5H9_9RHOB|nr:H-NS histone family protein [Sulfitobacter sp. PR48]MDD9722987.1 H-NS histone family protein [Sulfitobacter sp. PR48]GLT08230.1 trans-acting regulatory protein hvrA [Sulfitobacter porphyrae]